jgi:hypothetical protein
MMFSEFARERWGANWCLGPTSPYKRSRYGRVVKQSEYDAAERDWEIETYGAPLKSLQDAAPDMLAALREAEKSLASRAKQIGIELPSLQIVRAAIAKAEGR